MPGSHLGAARHEVRRRELRFAAGDVTGDVTGDVAGDVAGIVADGKAAADRCAESGRWWQAVGVERELGIAGDIAEIVAGILAVFAGILIFGGMAAREEAQAVVRHCRNLAGILPECLPLSREWRSSLAALPFLPVFRDSE